MCRRIALARAGPLRAPDEAEMHARGHDLHEAGEHVGARAHVAWLLLHPEHLAQLRVASHQLEELAFREGVEELDAPHRQSSMRFALGMTDEVVGDLARA